VDKALSEATVLKKEASDGVADANKKLKIALKLISQLRKDHIVEVKAINTPTDTVKLIV